MRPCVGWMGRLFGHRIERILVAEIPIVREEFWSSTITLATFTGKVPAKRKWAAVCVRCGFQPEKPHIEER